MRVFKKNQLVLKEESGATTVKYDASTASDTIATAKGDLKFTNSNNSTGNTAVLHMDNNKTNLNQVNREAGDFLKSNPDSSVVVTSKPVSESIVFTKKQFQDFLNSL